MTKSEQPTFVPATTSDGFLSLGASPATVAVLANHGIYHPTKVQAQAIPLLLNNLNVMAKAPTGTGKTATFVVPIVEHLSKHPKRSGRARALVLSPTRELSEQIKDTFALFAQSHQIRTSLIIGGVPERPQIAHLRAGTDVIVATPGRLYDLYQNDKVQLDAIEFFVLDEADMMLDMGFLPDIKRIYQALKQPLQIGLFSATIPPNIRSLAREMMPKHEYVAAEGTIETPKAIAQSAYYLDARAKKHLIAWLLKKRPNVTTVVFCNKKRAADYVAHFLSRAGIEARSIHGDKPQPVRKKIITAFKSGQLPVLIATDVAARGIHVDNVGLVINYDVPNSTDTYVHRMGRTARAGATGECITLASFFEGEAMRAITQRMRDQIKTLKFDLAEIGLTAASLKAEEQLVPEKIMRARRQATAQAKIKAQHERKSRGGVSKQVVHEGRAQTAFARTKRPSKPPFQTTFMAERATGGQEKAKRRVAEKQLRNRNDDDWSNI